jgi:DNA-binding transcriptional MerR regulator
MVSKTPEAFRNITEVSSMLNVPTHVLRFWETRFSQLKPIKRNGGRRYYRPEDIILLKRIQELLYDQGYTIKGAQQVLKSFTKPREDEAVAVLAVAGADAVPSSDAGSLSSADQDVSTSSRQNISKAITILKEAQSRLNRLG